MPLIATPGAHNATSFLTVIETTALLVGRPGVAAFTEATPLLKEVWPQQATRLLSLKVRWLGIRANPLELVLPIVQALPLPMVGQVDAYGELLPGVIPPLVKEATALVVLALAQEYAGDATATPAGLARLDVYQQVSMTYREPSTAVSTRVRFSQEVWDLLRLYGAVPMAGRHMPVVRGQG